MKKTLTADLEVGIVLVDCDPVPVRQVPVVILKQVHDLILLQCDLQPVGMDVVLSFEGMSEALDPVFTIKEFLCSANVLQSNLHVHICTNKSCSM